MILKEWNNHFSVNDPIMDQDHQKLMQMLNSLYEFMKKGQGKTVVSPMLNDLMHYAENHFYREERLLLEQNSPELDSQKQQHYIFLTKINEFKMLFEQGNPAIAVKMLPFLNEWFANHILKIDMKYKIVE